MYQDVGIADQQKA